MTLALVQLKSVRKRWCRRYSPQTGSAWRLEMWIAEASDGRTQLQMVFWEMPEVGLTRQQIRRLLSLPVDACEEALRALVNSGFLVESLEGVLVRGQGTLSQRS